MSTKILRNVVLLSSLFIISACASSHKTIAPENELALQEMQTKEFEAGKSVVFSSVLSVLQDVGYIIESGDIETGLITAKSPSSSKTSYNLLWGFGKKNSHTRVTAFIESIGEDYTKVRVNFLNQTGDSNAYGAVSTVDRPVEDPKVYDNLFEKVDETIFVKQALTN